MNFLTLEFLKTDMNKIIRTQKNMLSKKLHKNKISKSERNAITINPGIEIEKYIQNKFTSVFKFEIYLIFDIIFRVYFIV